MSFIVDANVAVKWAVPEIGADDAYAIYVAGGLAAPDLIFAECANALWKKASRGEMSAVQAAAAARVIEQAALEVVQTRTLIAPALDIALRLAHPAYDCLYLALARARSLKLVTADAQLLAKLAGRTDDLRGLAISIADAAALIKQPGP